MATTFFDLLEAVKAYYGSGSDQWVKIAQYGITQETLPILKQVPGVNFTYSNSGKILGYDYINPFPKTPDPASVIDSNIGGGGFAFDAEIPGTVVTDAQTGIHTIESGAKVASSGAKFAAIADKVSLGLAGVAIGTQLGKAIDGALYSLDPAWWDTHYPSINPETWDDMCTTKFGKNVVRAIFGLGNDDATMYLSQDLIAYTYLMLLSEGAFGSGDDSADIEDKTGLSQQVIAALPLDVVGDARTLTWSGTYSSGTRAAQGGPFIQSLVNTAPVYALAISPDSGSANFAIALCSLEPFSYTACIWNNNGEWPKSGSSSQVTFNGQTFHFVRSADSVINCTSRNFGVNHVQWGVGVWAEQCCYVALFGTITPGSIDGITNNANASIHPDPNSIINPTTGVKVTPEDDIDDVIQALKNAYPELFDNAIYEDVMEDDGTIKRTYYFPVPYPDTEDPTKPITDPTQGIDPQDDHGFNEDTRPEEQVQQWVINITYPPTTPDTGDGDTPPYVPPTGTASALYAIYNPTQAELNSFGAWLWSSNFVDQLLKLFNDPMQAIIGLHKVFAPPPISGVSTIKVGYLDSGVSSNTVGGQYVTIDCGTVSMAEYFGNVFDYDPFTQVHIYLPFIGIEPLDIGDIMRGQINVIYHVDVITGACLAEVKVIRDGAGGTIYTYSGNAAVQYPVSSGSYMGIVAALASVAGGIVGTVASGGALAPVAFGAVSGIMNAHARVNHSGSFSGNAGAMGIKKPYLIITRPQTAVAETFPVMDGYPANKSVIIGECNGFVAFESVHVENVPATDDELSEIESLLLNGIIISE